MLHERIPNLAKLVEPDRVHRLCYTDQEIFDQEMEHIFETTWVYCGHESQVREPGQFQTVQIGRNNGAMPAWGDILKPSDIAALWAYVVTGEK